MSYTNNNQIKLGFTLYLFMLVSIVQAQEIEYACIKNQTLFIYEYSTDTTNKLVSNYILGSRKKSLTVTKTEIPDFRANKLKVTWDILNNQLVSGTAISFSPSNSLAQIRLSPINLEDELITSEKYHEVLDSLIKLNNGNEQLAIANYKLNEIIKTQSNSFYPLIKWLNCSKTLNFTTNQWLDEIIKKHNFDITVHQNLIFIFHRKGSTIDIWRWDYLKRNLSSTQKEWIKIRSYEIGDPTKSLICNPAPSQDSLDTNYSTVITQADSNMAIGKLKFIIQNKEMFLFNFSSGKIYHLGKQINTVGEFINFQDSPSNFFNKTLVIEDKDNNIILATQEIKQFTNTGIFPRIEHITKDELEEYFEKQ